MHLRSGIRAFTLATAGIVLATACGGTSGPQSQDLASPDKQVLNVNDGTEPNSYDPTQQTYTYEAGVGREVFETLLKPNKDGTDVQSAAAESYKVSSDGLTYTFTLRANAKWSDGQTVKAADFVYGYKHLLNPALAAGYVDPFFDSTIAGADGYGSVDVSSASAIDTFVSGLGLSAPDDKTFVIKLQHPAAFFKWVVTLWVAAPIRQDIVEKAAGGSFSSSDTTKPEVWAQKAETVIGNGPFKISEIVSKDHVTLVPNPNYWGGAPHFTKITEWFIEDANTAFAKDQTFDAAAAKQLLQKAGVSASDLNKFKLLTRNTTRNKTLNQFIVDQWNTNLGLNMQLEVIDSKTVTSRIRKGDFDIYGPDGWGADYPDQQDWFDIFFTASCHSLNWGCVDLPGYDDLVKQADTELDQAKRNADYKKAQDQLINSAAVAFIFQDYEYNLIKGYVGGLTITAGDDQSLPGNFFWHDAYILKH